MDDIIVPELQNVDTTLIIDPDTRTIDVGSDFLLGVETDNDAERVKFQCSKIVGDNLDLSQYHIYIHYQNAKGEKGKYLCEDIEDSGENITFSWLLSQKAVLYKGQTKFLVCAKKTQEDTIVWNTTLASGNVLEGLDVDEEIVQQNDDVIEQILLKLEQIEASGGSYTLPIATPTQLGGVKPVAKTDEMTQEVGVDEAGRLFTKEGDGIDEETLNQINRNTEDISKLSDEKADKEHTHTDYATKEDLKNVSVSKEQIKSVVENYLEENPIEGGGSSEWKLIIDTTTTEEVKELYFTEDMNGNPISFNEVYMFGNIKAGTTATTLQFGTKVYRSDTKTYIIDANSKKDISNGIATSDSSVYGYLQKITENAIYMRGARYIGYPSNQNNYDDGTIGTTSRSLYFNNIHLTGGSTQSIPVGSRIRIWAR